jgi:hypothetical protein
MLDNLSRGTLQTKIKELIIKELIIKELIIKEL